MTRFAGAAFHRRCVTTSLTIRPGLVAQISQRPPGDPLSLEFEIEDSPIIFGFMVSGSNRCGYRRGPLRGTTRLHTSGSNGISRLSDTAGIMTCGGGMCRLSLLTETAFLYPYLAATPAGIPRRLECLLEGRGAAFQWTGKHCARKLRLLADIVTSAYVGPLRALHREIRALELMELQLGEYLARDSARQRTASLSPSDTGRIREAREILVRDMENPPTLARLARMAGIGEKKLKTGFRQVFGLPVFEYFRNYRMEVARQLLASGAMNVTEAGTYVGYQSLGHFSQAFFRRYGVTPGQWRRGRK